MSVYAPAVQRSATGRGTSHECCRLARRCERRTLDRERATVVHTDNHRDGVHDSRALPDRPVWDDGSRVSSSGGWFEPRPGPVRLRRSSTFSILRRLRGGPFRMMELNVVGWPALLAPPAVVGGARSWPPGRCGRAGRCWRRVGGGCGLGPVALVEERGFGGERSRLRRAARSCRAPSCWGVDVTIEPADFGLAVSPGADRQDIESQRLATRRHWVNRVLVALGNAPAARSPD